MLGHEETVYNRLGIHLGTGILKYERNGTAWDNLSITKTKESYSQEMEKRPWPRRF